MENSCVVGALIPTLPTVGIIAKITVQREYVPFPFCQIRSTAAAILGRAGLSIRIRELISSWT